MFPAGNGNDWNLSECLLLLRTPWRSTTRTTRRSSPSAASLAPSRSPTGGTLPWRRPSTWGTPEPSWRDPSRATTTSVSPTAASPPSNPSRWNQFAQWRDRTLYVEAIFNPLHITINMTLWLKCGALSSRWPRRTKHSFPNWGPFAKNREEPAMLILQASGRFSGTWQHRFAEIWLDKNSTVTLRVQVDIIQCGDNG